MSIKDDLTEVTHHVQVRLSECFLPRVKGRYFARTAKKNTLSIDRICESMKTRGGYLGSYSDLVHNIKQFLEEIKFLLCDGYHLNLKFFSIHPNIGGTFKDRHDAYDPEKHPITFRYRTLLPLKRAIDFIKVEIMGFAESKAHIKEFTDDEQGRVNDAFSAGNMFSITGDKIKIAGEHADNGVYFVPVLNPAAAVKVARIAENTASKVTGIAPDASYAEYRVEVRTQFNGSNTEFLKEPRVIAGRFVLTSI